MTASTGDITGMQGETSLWSRMTIYHRTKVIFMAAAFFSFALSVALWFLVDREMGLFVGLWVPTLLSLGTLLLVGENRRS